MELWKEILADLLSREHAQITFPNLTVNAAEIVENTSYQALQK